MKKLLLSCIVTFILSCNQSIPGDICGRAAPYTTTTYKDVIFSRVGDRNLTMDIVVPNDAQNCPGIIWFHGGAYSIGDKSYAAQMVQYLASFGIVAATADYRLLPDGANLDDMLADVESAFTFLQANADTYHLDRNSLSLGGDSAGAHLALLVGMKHPSAAVVSAYGSTDISLLYHENTLVGFVFERLMGSNPTEDPERWRQASPIHNIRKDQPPILLIHGTKDHLIPFYQSEIFFTASQNVGANIQLIPVDADHAWLWDSCGEQSVQTYHFIIDFLQRQN